MCLWKEKHSVLVVFHFVVFPHGAQGYNAPKGLSVWWMNFMCYYTGSLGHRTSVWVME